MQKRNGGKKIKILGGEVIKGGRGEGGTYTNTMGDQIGLREDKREQQLCEACKREIKGRKEHYLSNCAKNRFAVSRYIKSFKKKKAQPGFLTANGSSEAAGYPDPGRYNQHLSSCFFLQETHAVVCVLSLFSDFYALKNVAGFHLLFSREAFHTPSEPI